MTPETKTGLGELVAALCQTNIELWHEEDKARCEDDNKVARAKRSVDQLNQKRNDFIEKIDDWVIKEAQTSKDH